MRWILLVAMAGIVVGCNEGASLISSSAGLGGIQKGPKWGVVQYSVMQNVPESTARSLAKARVIMEGFCSPQNYRVVDQKYNSSSETAFYQGSGGSFQNNSMFVRFECEGLITTEQQSAIKKRKEQVEGKEQECPPGKYLVETFPGRFECQ